MAKVLVKIIDPQGLHARPASILVSSASKYTQNSIALLLDNNTRIDAKSIMNVLGSSIESNQEFYISVEGLQTEIVISDYIKLLCEKKILSIV